MLAAVVRILWFMVQQQKKAITEPMDKQFLRAWFSNIRLASGQIVRKTDQ